MSPVKWLAAVLASSALASAASATVINFDDQGLTGPSLFSQVTPSSPVITLDGVTATFSGGGILTAATNLPANRTSIYGTASFLDGGLNPITVAFSDPIENFALTVLNGDTSSARYRLFDEIGNSSTFTLQPNLNGGASTLGFAASGRMISILALVEDGGIEANIGNPNDPRFFDFFIDNISFNAELPSDIVTPDEVVVVNPDTTVIPLPATAFLLLGALGALGFVRRSA